MWRVLFLGLIMVIISGCGLSSAGAIAADPADPLTTASLPPVNPDISDAPITLEVWLDLDFTRDNSLYDELAEEFEAAYPQVDVKIFSFVRESIPRRVELEVLSAVPPDVVMGHVYAMAGRGLAEPLEDQWAAWERQQPDASSQFLPAAMNEVTWQNERYGVPLDIYTIILLYNREHFDQAGLAYPEGEYDLFYLPQAAEILSDPVAGRFGFGLTTDPWYASVWFTGAGGDLITGSPDEGYNLTFNTGRNVETLFFLTQMVDNGIAALPSSRPRDYEETRRLFLDGKISMYFAETQDIHLIQSTNPDFPLGVSHLPLTPAKDRAESVLGSSGLFVPRGAANKQVAFEFIKWMVSDRYVLPMARRQGRYPAKTWLQTSPEFTKNLSLLPFFDQLNSAQPYRLDLFPDAEEAFSNALKSAYYDLGTPNEVLQAAQFEGQNSMLESTP
ncbi:MAG: extracellular solute-binding protein [Anaerolineae bacterium]|nr:extracellular solute-binding protein [Anaerolineae bacterium]